MIWCTGCGRRCGCTLAESCVCEPYCRACLAQDVLDEEAAAVSDDAMTNWAEEWVAADRPGCQADVKRLGLVAAAQYHLRLARDRVADGDSRWIGLTLGDLRDALERFVPRLDSD